jgi:hypothetical protein
MLSHIILVKIIVIIFLLSENDFNSSEDESIIVITNMILEHFHAMTYFKM